MEDFKWIRNRLLLFGGSALAAMGILSNTDYRPFLYADPNLTNDVSDAWLYTQRVFSYDKITAILVVIILMIGYERIVLAGKWSKRDRIFGSFSAALFAIVQTLGASFASSDGWDELTKSPILKIRGVLSFWGWLMVSYLIICCVFRYADRLFAAALKTAKIETEKKKFWKKSGILCFCYLPYLIALLPGTNNGDTIYMISEYFGFFSHSGLHSMSSWGKNGDFIHNHHPYFTTWIFGSFAKIGRLLTHNRSIAPGIVLFGLVQIGLIAVLIVSWWTYLEKEGLDERLCKAGYIFCAVFPGFGLMAVCMIKDSMFMIFILWASLQLLKIVRSNGEILKQPFFVIRLAASSLLIALTKSQGIYMILVIGVILMITYRKRWISVMGGLFLPFLFVELIWLKTLLPAWNIAPAGHQELIGPIMQQTARYVAEHEEEVTPEERNAINGIMSYEKIAKKYDPVLTDPIKKLYHSEATKEELAAYYKVWFKMLLKHPKSYMDATFNVSYPFFYVSVSKGMYKYAWKNDQFSEKKKNGLYARSAFPMAGKLVMVFQLGVQKVPVIGLLFTVAFYTWLTLLVVALQLRKRNYSSLIYMSYLLLNIAVYFIVPTGSGRYAWTLVAMAPFMLATYFLRTRTNNAT